MNMNPEILKRYFNGTCSPEERIQAIEYLTANDNELPVLHELLEQEKQTVIPREIPPVMHKSLVYGIRKNAYADFLKLVRPKPRIWRYAVGMAAILLPLLVFIGIKTSTKVSETIPSEIAMTDRWDTITNHTSAAQKATLPDGSTVWLMAKSSLSYMPQQYGQANRSIRLEGEGFFDVQPDTARPFIVYHGDIYTRVLGTAFNIEAYGDESDIRISLVRGKVAVNRTGDTAMLQPLRYLTAGDRLIYQKQDGHITIKPIAYNDEETYTKGWMVLDAVPLTAALKRIERYYDLKILIPSDIDAATKKITAIFKGGTSDEILQNILFPYRLKFTKRGNTIYIEKNNSH